MAYDTSISLPRYMSTYDLPSPDMLPNIQRTAVTGYNSNSIIGYNTNSNCSSACRTFTLPASNYSIVFIQHIRNVSIFNMYIYEKIHKINNSIDNLSKHLGGNTYSSGFLQASLPASYDASLKRSIPLIPSDDALLDSYFWPYPDGDCTKFIIEKEVLKDACVLHLIGTPEDVEELSMLPGIIVRDVSDETFRFIQSNVLSGSNIFGILHAEGQLIRYKLETYYRNLGTDWWPTFNSRIKELKMKETDLYDRPYSECSDFMNPKHMYTVEPTYTQQINPDERVYQICIQMSDDLVATAYKKSNFFISIRNNKKKMSIKNFIEYLS